LREIFIFPKKPVNIIPLQILMNSRALISENQKTGQLIGKKIFELDRVDSTNAFANLMLSEGKVEDGDVIWSHEQFAGRGQLNHTWVSEPGRNLTFTVILRPVFLPPDRQFRLNKAVSLAVADFVRASLQQLTDDQRQKNPSSDALLIPETDIRKSPVKIKWPNDIYAGNLKIGGILIENKIMGSTLDSSLVGIGVNINQSDFSPDVPNPVSLIRLLNRETPVKDALILLCRHLDLRYSTLKSAGQTSLDDDFEQQLLGFEQWREFLCNGEKTEGKIIGVNDLGQLKIETSSRKAQLFSHREIEYLF
jgi:BirA family transcriptional regulator, biotin operon repressor / biotin---[acetyl-CoA-carboxylase] ligase